MTIQIQFILQNDNKSSKLHSGSGPRIITSASLIAVDDGCRLVVVRYDGDDNNGDEKKNYNNPHPTCV